jgi:type I restriction enzyme R subunit
MMLTGFDAKKVNTLYVDKNLKQHGLIQAFSRTNRILGEQKSQGTFYPLETSKAQMRILLCFRIKRQSSRYHARL